VQKGYLARKCEPFGLGKRSGFLDNTLILLVPKIKAQEMGRRGPITRITETRNTHQILFAKILKGNILLERTGCRCEADKVKMDRKEREYEGVNSINLFMINSN
jgi:hypothetical protein